MKTMKKGLVWLLTLAMLATMCLSLVSCSSNESESLSGMQGKIDELQATLDATIAKDATVQQMQTTIEKLQTLVSAMNTTSEEPTTTVIDPTDAIAEVKKTIDALQESVNASVAKNESVEALQASIEALQESVSALENKVGSNSNGNTNELKNLLKSLQTSVDLFVAKDASVQQLQASINKLQATIDAANAPSTALLAPDYGQECFEKIQYIDSLISDRDCLAGANFKFCQKWIKWNLIQAGYAESEIIEQDFTINKTTYAIESEIIAKSYTTDGKHYSKSGRTYTVDEEGPYVKITSYVTSNIVVVKQGKSDNQIIIGAHYDGDGTGDNGSGIALALTTAQHVHDIETPNTLVFIFFSAEEKGCLGSTAYANAMTDEEVAKTLYMINLDSLVCGDYCYLYGGVADTTNKTVSKTDAFENAMAVANSIGLTFKSNPWTFENPEPTAKNGVPKYPSPATGDWSDHKGFKNRGISYLYFEATNWEIPDYSGYGETYLIGMLMNTARDYLEYIETYFPGRVLHHITQFSALMNALVLQENYAK